MGHAILSTVVRAPLPRVWSLFISSERLAEWLPGVRVIAGPGQTEIAQGEPFTLVLSNERRVRLRVTRLDDERRVDLRWARDDGTWGAMSVAFETSVQGTVLHLEHFWVSPWNRRAAPPSPVEEVTQRLPVVAAARPNGVGLDEDQELELRFRLHLQSFRVFAEESARLRPDLEAA